jgi:hypothetical protein
MSLVFSPVCNRCIVPIPPNSGRVCSCSCFLCDDCSKLLVDKVRNDQGACPACFKKGVISIIVGGDSVPSEVSTSLSDATSRLENLHEILSFQSRHYRKALDSAFNSITRLKKENVSLQNELNNRSNPKRKFFEQTDSEEGFYEGAGSGLKLDKRSRSVGGGGSSAPQISPPSKDAQQQQQQSRLEMMGWQMSPDNSPPRPSTTQGSSSHPSSLAAAASIPSAASSVGGARPDSISISTRHTYRPQTSPEKGRISATSAAAESLQQQQRMSPHSRQQSGPRWGGGKGSLAAMSPSSLYTSSSSSGRAQSPSNLYPNPNPTNLQQQAQYQQRGMGNPSSFGSRGRGGGGRGGSSPPPGSGSGSGLDRVRSPYLAIRSPQLQQQQYSRPGTGGSIGSVGGRGSIVGARSTTATKDDLLRQRHDEWLDNEQAKSRQEVSRFSMRNQ